MEVHQLSDGTLWAIREIKESSDELLELLDKKELYLPSLQGMVAENRKKEWLSIRVLLRDLLNEEKEIIYSGTGKPSFADHSYYISLSHTKGFVAVILSKDHPVSIDIEYHSPRVKKIRTQFMSENEELNVDKKNEETHLLLHWSAKECLFKMLDMEAVFFKENLHIKPFVPALHSHASFEAYETRTEQQQTFSIRYFVSDQYIISYIC